jgi:transcription termination factor NusB
MQPLNIKLYDLARAKLHLNDTDAMDFVSSIHELQDHRFENLVTKEYLDQKLFGITEKINKLENSISEFKADNLKWMFIFWVGQLSITIGIVLMLIKK